MLDTRRLLVALLAAGTVGACTSMPQESEFGSGTYVLRSVAGEPLPAAVFGPGFGVAVYVADSIRFEPRALALFAGPVIERETVVMLPGGQPQASIEHIGYERDGSRFSFRYSCPPEADCAIGLIQGIQMGDWLEITMQGPYRSPLRYERVP